MMEDILFLYDLTLAVSIIIILIIILLLIESCYRFKGTYSKISSKIRKNIILEIIFFIFPTIITAFLIIPNFFLITSLGEIHENICIVNATASQWQWSYQVKNHIEKSLILSEVSNKSIIPIYLGNIELSSSFYFLLNNSCNITSMKYTNYTYNITSNIINSNIYRLIDITNSPRIPILSWIKFNITSIDVIHSFSIQSCGIKLDATPGRINTCEIFIKKPGLLFGFCSELCGIGHYRMPILLKAI